jgi:hypothetical protein
MQSILKPRPVTHSVYANVPSSRAGRRLGAIMTGFVILLLLVDSVGKLIPVAPAVAGTVQLGYPEWAVRVIGIILLVCLVAHAVPRTSVLGAILLTGYLGGAVGAHLRVGSPLLTHTLVPIYLGVLIWCGLALREDRLRGLFPLRR